MTRPPCDWIVQRPIAHRGLHDQKTGIVENTRTAFARAISADYAIECDLQLSADGEAMVFHDDTLTRLTLADGPVKAHTASELAQIGLRNSSDTMQTLCELLAQVDARVPLVIEIKSQGDQSCELAERTIDVLSSYRGNFSLMSFDPFLVDHVAKNAPNFVRGAVIMPITEGYWTHRTDDARTAKRVIDEIAPDFLSCDVRGLPNELAMQFRQKGAPIICWTIRDEQTAKTAYNYCDQITFEGFLPS